MRDSSGVSSSVRAGLAVAIGLLSVFLLTGCCSLPSSKTAPGIGETATNNEAQVKVQSVKFLDQMTDELGGVRIPQDEALVYAIVDVTVRNVGKRSIRVGRSQVSLLDKAKEPQGKVIVSKKPDALVLLPETKLAPGQEASGALVYATPRGTVLDQVLFTYERPIRFGLRELVAEVPEPAPLPGVGQPAGGGGLEVKVLSVSEPTKLTSGSWTTSAPQGSRLVVVNLQVKNLDREPAFVVDPGDVLIVDDEDIAYSGKEDPALGLPAAEKLSKATLAPGRSTKGKVVVALPNEKAAQRIRYRVGVLGPPLEVRLTK